MIFEGRDAAGKGGVIKRITQRLNPRVCRVAALPAPNERERTQWYFQRYVAHLPAAGEIVLFDRSWYNRAGVERVMGFCTDDEYEEFFRTVPEFERMLVRSGIQLIKYWFSITDEEQHAALPRPHPRSAQAVEAEPDGPGVAPPLGGVHQGQGNDAGAHPHSRGAVVGGGGRRQEEGAAELHRATCSAQIPYEEVEHPPIAAAASACARRLLAPPGAGRACTCPSFTEPAGRSRRIAFAARRRGRLGPSDRPMAAGRRSCYRVLSRRPPMSRRSLSPLTRAYQRNLKALAKATLGNGRRIATRMRRAATQGLKPPPGRGDWIAGPHSARAARAAITCTGRRASCWPPARSCR